MNTLLETGISLVLIFFIFSIITYVIQELIAVNFKYRSKMLWKSISQLLDGFQMEGRQSLQKELPLGRTPVTDEFFAHAQVKSLQKDLKRLPAYIPASNFALAIMDMVAKKSASSHNDLYAGIKDGLKTLENSRGNIYPVLKNLFDTAANLEELQDKLETWFNDYMNRVSGWYQSQIVFSVRLIAIGLTIIFNINVLKITKLVYNDEQLRTGMVTIAEKAVADPSSFNEYYKTNFDKEVAGIDSLFNQRRTAAGTDVKRLLTVQKDKEAAMAAAAEKYTQKKIEAIGGLTKQLSTTGLPLGWSSKTFNEDIAKKGLAGWLLLLIGWGIGAGCIAMGAPFWFDMLAKLVNVRRSGIKPGMNDNRGA